MVIKLEVKLKCLENGPIIVSVEGSDKKTAICRCGQSGIKPFCDGEHRKCGFEAAALELVVTED